MLGPFKTDHSSGEYGKQRGDVILKPAAIKKRKLHREHTKDPTQTRLKTILFLQEKQQNSKNMTWRKNH